MTRVVAPVVRLFVLGALDLRDAQGEELRTVLVQPKRLALLTYLALARPLRFHRRDALVALFWPESDAERARLALRQALHFLRRTLGAQVIVARGGEEIGIAPNALWCDALEFESAFDDGRYAEALALYRGDLLPAFFVADVAPDLEQWLEAERARLRTMAAAASWGLSEVAERAGSCVEASHWARHAVHFAPNDDASFRRLVAVLDRCGDRAGILREFDEFAQRLKQELDVEPAAQTRVLVHAVCTPERASCHTDSSTLPMRPARVVVDGRQVRSTEGSNGRVDGDQLRSGASAPPPVVRRRSARWITAVAMLGVSFAIVLAPFVPPLRVASLPVARRLYEEGLRAYNRGEWRGAHQLFSAALKEDSTFAMAAYYAALSIRPFRIDSQFMLLVRAEQLARRAPDRDQLTIKYARHLYDYQTRAAVAESLMRRFPNDPVSQLTIADMRISAGDFVGALPYAKRVIAMDSLGLQGKTPLCRACDALRALLSAYAAMGIDSVSAVERVARAWIQRQPKASSAWHMLAVALSWQGQNAEALQALNRATQGEPVLARMYEHPSTMPAAMFASAVIQNESYAVAERLLRDRLRFDERDLEAIWWLVTTLRNQGRIKEALSLAKKAEQVAASEDRSTGTWEIVQAQLLFELGRFSEAARRFQLRMHAPNDDADYDAHAFSWHGVHAAGALAASGDTQQLPALADSIERAARHSAYGLAWRLPHHVRGLLSQARRQPGRAAVEFRAAVFSPTLGYTRTNVELARALTSLGRAHEAIHYLREALGGSSDGPGYYATRTEVHEWLARAFEAAGEPDSAAFHYGKVAEAWKNGDPMYRRRAAEARQKVPSIRGARLTFQSAPPHRTEVP